MLYLASQFLWFLLAAFGLGFVMGWISHEGGKAELWSGKLLYAAGAWALGAALTWTQALNGLPALWVESALLFVAIYFAGCALAAVMRSALEPQALAQGMLGLDGIADIKGAIVSLAGSEADAVLAKGRTAIDAAGEIKSVIDDGKTVITDMKAVRDAVRSPPAVEREAALPGSRPDGLVAARAGLPDDLKLIKGVGRQNEARLHGLGIWHFDQIAGWKPQNVEWVGGYLAFPGRIEREDWVGQAQSLARGDRSEFARRAAAGEVASSRDDGTHGQGSVAALNEGSFEGERPGNLLETARDGKPDDLVLIKAIGPAIAADLNRLGIWHFDQIALLKEPEIRYLRAFAKVSGPGGESWREDADILANGGDTAHSRAIKAGRKSPES